MKINTSKILEWGGAITAIIYSLLVSFNIGAILIALWAFKGNHKGILFLQLFYAIAGIIGMYRWFE